MSAITRDEEATPALLLLRTGDRAAMQAVFAEHGPGLARTIRALACLPATVEDLVQEVFVIAFCRVETCPDTVPLAAWLRGIAVNVVRNQRRRERRRGQLLRRFEPLASERPDTPEAALAGRRLAHRLWSAVDSLPDRQREAFVLRVIEQRSLAECAEVLGVSVKAVSRRAVAAQRQVRSEVEGKEDEG